MIITTTDQTKVFFRFLISRWFSRDTHRHHNNNSSSREWSSCRLTLTVKRCRPTRTQPQSTRFTWIHTSEPDSSRFRAWGHPRLRFGCQPTLWCKVDINIRPKTWIILNRCHSTRKWVPNTDQCIQTTTNSSIIRAFKCHHRISCHHHNNSRFFTTHNKTHFRCRFE